MASWVDVVGYEHSVLHAGVMWAVLGDAGASAGVASRLTGLPVSAVNHVEREKAPRGSDRQADLVADLVLADGSTRVLAVETKVHTDGSVEQLRERFGDAYGVGVLLAVGLSALKIGIWDTDNASSDRARWAFVDAARWLDVLEGVEGRLAWLPPYLESLKQWSGWLAAGAATEELPGRRMHLELDHLRWLADLRGHLRRPCDSTPITTLNAGAPMLTLWQWEFPGEGSAFVQLIGHLNGNRVLHLKVAVSDAAGLRALTERVADAIKDTDLPQLQPPGRRSSPGARSATIALAPLDGDPKEGAELTDRIVGGLDGVLSPGAY